MLIRILQLLLALIILILQYIELLVGTEGVVVPFATIDALPAPV